MTLSPRDDRHEKTAIGCDEDKGRFEEALGKIARYKPPPKTQMKSKKMEKPAK
jgi:hypothetical protein